MLLQKPTYPSVREKIPWLMVIASDCIILNKNGSLQQSFIYRGPDLDSVTEAEINIIIAQINNALKRIPGKWALWADSHRITSVDYPHSRFPDVLSQMLDDEKRIYFQKGTHFENKFYLTLAWLPPTDKESKWKNIFVKKGKKRSKQDDYDDYIRFFESQIGSIISLLRRNMHEIKRLNNDETMTYLHSCVSPKKHDVRFTEAYGIDYFLVDSPLDSSLEPKLGNYHLRTVGIRIFPDKSLPGLLDALNKLNFEYRWTTRFFFEDKSAALNHIEWIGNVLFFNRKSIMSKLKSVIGQDNGRVDRDVVRKGNDSEDATLELQQNLVSFGYFTMTITVIDKDLKRIENNVNKIEEIINAMQFTTITETYNAVDAWFGSLPGCGSNQRTPFMHTLNLAQMFPLSSSWTGADCNKHWGGPPLLFAQTVDGTHFRLDLHNSGDVGHSFVLGPTGSGKSALMCQMDLQVGKYPNTQVIVIDSGGSARANAAGLGGVFYDLGQEGTNVSFQPLANIDDENEIRWAFEWVCFIFENEMKISPSPIQQEVIYEALKSVAASPMDERTMTQLYIYASSSDIEVAQALKNYTIDGPHGKMFGGNKETLVYNRYTVFEMETLMENKKSVVEPTLMYIFHRIDQYFTPGKRSILRLDEAWKYIKNDNFRDKIEQWLRELRKRFVDVIFGSQSLAELSGSSFGQLLVESCPNKIFLPNPEASQEQIKPLYLNFGLNEREIEIIASAYKKRQYYIKTEHGSRLFELGLDQCPLNLAYCGASSKEDQEKILELQQQYNIRDFNIKWMEYKGLSDYAEVYRKATALKI